MSKLFIELYLDEDVNVVVADLLLQSFFKFYQSTGVSISGAERSPRSR
jgi:hypothetical protein